MKHRSATAHLEKQGAHGEGYYQIIKYIVPECITNLVIYSLPIFLDAYFVSSLRSTPMYSVLGATNNMLHWVVKVAEALSIGTVIMAGLYNGRSHFEGVGRVLRDAFWTTIVIGGLFTAALYWGAPYLYRWYLPAELVPLGVPFLRLKSLSLLFMFVFFAFVGFLRGIKNARAAMKMFIFGSLVFLVLDYGLIFGAFGLPKMGLYGSAYASIAQYALMSLVAIGYVLCNKKNYKYACDLFSVVGSRSEILRLLQVSWPIILDKSVMALAYIWLLRMMKPLGGGAVATFCVVKDMERCAFLPAIACAQVITFLVSNDVSIGAWKAVKANIRRVISVALALVFTALFVMAWHSRFFITLFDKQGDFVDMAAAVFPVLSALVCFDILQVILSGALRGSGDVKTVLFVRSIVCFGYFIPVSYGISLLPIASVSLQFILIYGAFYIGNGLMSMVYIHAFRSKNIETEIK